MDRKQFKNVNFIVGLKIFKGPRNLVVLGNKKTIAGKFL